MLLCCYSEWVLRYCGWLPGLCYAITNVFRMFLVARVLLGFSKVLLRNLFKVLLKVRPKSSTYTLLYDVL